MMRAHIIHDDNIPFVQRGNERVPESVQKFFAGRSTAVTVWAVSPLRLTEERTVVLAGVFKGALSTACSPPMALPSRRPKSVACSNGTLCLYSPGNTLPLSVHRGSVHMPLPVVSAPHCVTLLLPSDNILHIKSIYYYFTGLL